MVLKPREVILGNDKDPYTIRTLLGWGIIGRAIPINGATDEEDDHSFCHRVVRVVKSEVLLDSTANLLSRHKQRRWSIPSQ